MPAKIMKLPDPRTEGTVSVEQALLTRRSVRRYKNEPLTIPEISQLVWSAQGVSNPRGYRTTPSAGALYPLEVYVVAGNINHLPAGIYKYLPGKHVLLKTIAGDRRSELSRAALHQSSIANAPAVLLLLGLGLLLVFLAIGMALPGNGTAQ